MVVDQPEVAARLRAAYPARVAPEVSVVLQIVPEAKHSPFGRDIGPVVLDGEQLSIPCRIYSPEPDPLLVTGLSDTQRRILASLYTRHHDGYVRERYLNQLLDSVDPWTPPYVLALVGEYVIQILHLVMANISTLRNECYAHFVSENPPFIDLIRRRVISYWNCYYRGQYPRLSDYPGAEIMRALGVW